jgi:hypothetical protein
MEIAGVVIVIALLAAVVCGKAGSAGGALFFLALALVVFINTPAGAGLPGAIGSFLDSINQATSPALNRGAGT